MDEKIGHLTADLKVMETEAAEDTKGAFEAILSAPTVDRDGEVIDAGAFDPLPDHLTIDIDHGMSTRSTVGSGQPFYDGDTLMFRGTFSSLPLAQDVRTLVTEGHVRKMSVAFMNADREEDDDGIVHIRSAELLNAAIVPIPSNREASILAAKAFDQLKQNLVEEVDALSKQAFPDPPAIADAAEIAAAPAAAISAAPALAKAAVLRAEAALLLTE